MREMKMIYMIKEVQFLLTGSLKATCANDIKRDIQLANFLTDDDIILLHQGELVGTSNKQRTHERILISAEKPLKLQVFQVFLMRK